MYVRLFGPVAESKTPAITAVVSSRVVAGVMEEISEDVRWRRFGGKEDLNDTAGEGLDGGRSHCSRDGGFS